MTRGNAPRADLGPALMTGSSWHDVEELVRRLPDAVPGRAHEGSPAFCAGRHQFARLRWDDGDRQIVQLWSGDLSLPAALAGRPEVFPVIHTFQVRVSLWAFLDALDRRELAELLLDSYRIRGGSRRADLVDESAYFGQSPTATRGPLRTALPNQ